MGPCGISVQFVVDLYRGDRFVAAKTHTVKMCIYSPIGYVLAFNLSISVSYYLSLTALSLETATFHLVCKKLVLSSANFQSQNDLQTERGVSSNLSVDMLPQVCLKQYAGLHIDTLVVPVVEVYEFHSL